MGNFNVLDRNGNPLKTKGGAKVNFSLPSKNASNLFGNIYSYGNAGKYAYRYYSLQDTNSGLDTYSRELLVKWSREIAAQLPVVSSAIKILSQFAVDDAYLPEYVGNNKEWGKAATEWLVESFYPNCCTRGNAYNFQTSLKLLSQTIDTDGDVLQVFGKDKYGFPMFQIIPSHRIKSNKDNAVINEGKYKDCIIADGIVYTQSGKAVGYVVQNPNNLVSNMVKDSGEEIIFDTKDAHLIFDARFFDKNRGIPSIAPAILQAMSIQELDRYLMDKLKIESMIGLIEKNQTGEAPQELQDTLNALLEDVNNTGNPLMISPNDHAVQIVNGAEIRYVRADGGDIKTLSSNSPAMESQEYMSKLETQILATLGVPHQLIFSPQKASGRVTSAIAEVFRSQIKQRQGLLDKHGKFTIAWALSHAMEQGFIPRNNEENLFKAFEFTKPQEFSLDAKYDNQIIIDNLNNGIITLNDATSRICNKSANRVIEEQADEQIKFYKEAKRVSDTTGIDINLVISNWKNTPVQVTNTIQTDLGKTENE